MVVVLQTESEDMEFFFQGGDELPLLLYLQPLVAQHNILRVDATSQFVKGLAGVVVIGHGAPPKERQRAQPATSPHDSGSH